MNEEPITEAERKAYRKWMKSEKNRRILSEFIRVESDPVLSRLAGIKQVYGDFLKISNDIIDSTLQYGRIIDNNRKTS